MRLGFAISAVLLAAAPALARGDAGPPSTYWIRTLDDGSVTIYLSGPRACADGPLLRKSLDTGDVVALTTCDPHEPQRFVDECVPAGRYQYGLATPYTCSEFGSAFYAEVTAPAPPAGCTPKVAAPTPAAGVPWGSDPSVCESSYHGGEDRVFPSGCGPGGAVLGTNLALLLAGAALWRRRPGRRIEGRTP